MCGCCVDGDAPAVYSVDDEEEDEANRRPGWETMIEGRGGKAARIVELMEKIETFGVWLRVAIDAAIGKDTGRPLIAMRKLEATTIALLIQEAYKRGSRDSELVIARRDQV